MWRFHFGDNSKNIFLIWFIYLLNGKKIPFFVHSTIFIASFKVSFVVSFEIWGFFTQMFEGIIPIWSVLKKSDLKKIQMSRNFDKISVIIYKNKYKNRSKKPNQRPQGSWNWIFEPSAVPNGPFKMGSN